MVIEPRYIDLHLALLHHNERRQIRVLPDGGVEIAMTGFDAGVYGTCGIIISIPLRSVELRLTEDGINQLWIRTSTESD